MEEFGEDIAYPTIEQICQVNRRMIAEFDGLFLPPNNLSNLHALEYILDAIKLSIYGYTIYPTLKEKASAIAYHIISRHVFWDGNKRTAIHIAWEFLNSNGKSILLDSSIEELSVAIAARKATQDELLKWMHNHQDK